MEIRRSEADVRSWISAVCPDWGKRDTHSRGRTDHRRHTRHTGRPGLAKLVSAPNTASKTRNTANAMKYLALNYLEVFPAYDRRTVEEVWVGSVEAREVVSCKPTARSSASAGAASSCSTASQVTRARSTTTDQDNSTQFQFAVGSPGSGLWQTAIRPGVLGGAKVTAWSSFPGSVTPPSS
eukprot:3933164-Rhodomonas_salina.2